MLLFPLALPVLILASRATTEALDGRPIPSLWWGLLIMYDWVFVVFPYLTFDYILED